jgi:hypothetical protein
MGALRVEAGLGWMETEACHRNTIETLMGVSAAAVVVNLFPAFSLACVHSALAICSSVTPPACCFRHLCLSEQALSTLPCNGRMDRFQARAWRHCRSGGGGGPPLRYGKFLFFFVAASGLFGVLVRTWVVPGHLGGRSFPIGPDTARRAG